MIKFLSLSSSNCFNDFNNNIIYERNSIVSSNMIKHFSQIKIYNGHIFQKVKLNYLCLNHRLGEFSLTRVYPKHPHNKRQHLAKKYNKKKKNNLLNI